MSAPALNRRALLPTALIELVATTLFLFLTMSAVAALNRDWVAVALAFGGAIAVLIIVFTHHSGAHMNPAVSLGLWATKRLDGRTTIAYIVAQLAGGILGSFLASWAMPEGTTIAAGAVTFARNLTPVSGLLVEMGLTFFLVLVVFATSVDHRNDVRFAPAVIGLTVLVAVLAGGPITGAAMNPARWLGPAMVTGQWANVTAYTAGPLLGGLLAALAYQQFLLPKEAAAADEEE